MKWSVLVPGIATAVYCLVSLKIIFNERAHPGGGWISLNGMGTFLATFPGAILFQALGRFDYKSNLQVSVSLLTTAALVFGLVFAVMRGAANLF
jgi:hypothetical protein